MRFFAISLIKFYRYFISPLKPSSCRYYPSCSQYAILQFQYNNFFRAFYFTFIRILRCNQLFSGGFEYPLIKLKTKSKIFDIKKEIKNLKVLFVPKDKQFYYIVKIIFNVKG